MVLLEVSGRGSELNGIDATFNTIGDLVSSILYTWPLAIFFVVFGLLGYYILTSRETTHNFEYTESFGYMGEYYKKEKKEFGFLDTDEYDHRIVSWGVISFFFAATFYVIFIFFNFFLGPISALSDTLAKWVFIIYIWLMSICLSISIICIPGFLLSLKYRKSKYFDEKNRYIIYSCLIYLLTALSILGFIFACPYIYGLLFPFFFPLP